MSDVNSGFFGGGVGGWGGCCSSSSKEKEYAECLQEIRAERIETISHIREAKDTLLSVYSLAHSIHDTV